MSKRDIKLSTPRGDLITYTTKAGKVSCKVEWNSGFETNRTAGFERAQVFVDSAVMRLSDPYVPFDTGVLKTSTILATVVGSGGVEYNTPYARKQYLENKGNGLRGRHWFERMKADHKEEIFAGAAKITGGKSK